MNRLPIRMRLTAAFALAMLLVLAGAATLAYVRVRSELNDSVDADLAARAVAAADPALPLTPPAEAEEGFVQVVARGGRVLESVGGARARVLDRATLARAARGRVIREASVPGIEGTARILARPAPARAGAPVVVAGQSLGDRDETLVALLKAFLIGGIAAVLAASLLGYLLARAGLAPVEAMRRRATEVSLERDESLPLPPADDEVRRLGATLNDMVARLRATFEREREFVADAGHELRTPITVIKTELEAALRNEPAGSEVHASLAAALEETDHLGQLADDLLVLARSGDGALPLRAERVELRALLEGVRERFADRARERRRSIGVTVAPGLVADVDPLRMRQALSNLVDNALRHGGGEVTLTAARDTAGALELTVADAGAGFDAATAADAFERFTRGDAARTTRGAGLGLAIVRAIARAHGGDAEIAEGAAAAVTIRIPPEAS